MKTFEEYIFESSVGRFIDYIDNKFPILVITASRSERPKEVNERLNEDLRKFIRKAGFGFFRVVGHYPEIVNGKDGQPKEIDAKDDSVIVTTYPENEEKLLALGKYLGKKYEQDSILFYGHLKGATVNMKSGKYAPYFIGTRPDSSVGGMYAIHQLGDLHIDQPSKFITQIKKNYFNFDYEPTKVTESKPHPVSGMNEAITRDAFFKMLLNESAWDI